LVVFADDWGRHPSSCQHLIGRLVPHWRILWVNTVGTRQPRADFFTLRRGWEKVRRWLNGLRQISDQMWVLDTPMLPSLAHPLPRGVNKYLVTQAIQRVMRQLKMSDPLVLTTLPYTQWLVPQLCQRGLVYYRTDDYSYWPSADGDALRAAESDTLKHARLILAASKELARTADSSPRCMYFPHGVDYQHFAGVEGATTEPSLTKLPKPRIGFFGLIYEKLDFELLSAVARQLNPASLVCIGPVDYCPTSFRRLANVHLLGKKPYAELPGWLAGLDVLLLPYVRDEMIRQSRPLKLLECLATGRPTVSIDIPEVRAFEPHVRVAQTTDHFIQAVREAIHETAPDSTRVSRQHAVRRESWDCRAEQLNHLLHWVHEGHSGAAPTQANPAGLDLLLNANSIA
jgi:glycosyltransferase involved in cell wall biosynthesis